MRFLGVMIGLLALGFASAALAGEKFDPKEVRVITPTSATSKCIGQPKTPICAVETLLACRGLNKQELCDLVGVHNQRLDGEAYSYSYRIMKSHIYAKREIPKSLADSYWIKPGYADVVIEDISFDNMKCTDFCRVSYAVRPSPTGWIVIEWVALGVL
jgi:hypothetical protein